MEKQNSVSLWLGSFETEKDFRAFINEAYTEDGDRIPSQFEKIYGIAGYDPDFLETDWISRGRDRLSELLEGFSRDEIIIPRFETELEGKEIRGYNSVILLYDFDYTGKAARGEIGTDHGKIEFIASVNG